MTGYVRKDTTNNIADGNIINASDLDAEFDGVVDAFNASTGHKHDGSSGEGAPITTIGPTQDVVASATAVTPKTTNTVDIGSSSLKFKNLWLAGNANVAGTTTLGGALTYGGVTLSNAVTGTGNMVLSTSPTLTGTLTAAAANFSGAVALNGNSTLGDAVGDTVTVNGTATFVNANPTLSAGTANGVAYLNGSKVVTTGSALTFTGTRLGIGEASPVSALTVKSGNGDQVSLNNAGERFTQFTLQNNGTSKGALWVDNTNSLLELFGYSGMSLTFSANGSEQMRLTSTGLGIGTSSPVSKLSIEVALETALAQTNDGITLRAPSGSTGRYALVNFSGSGYAGNVAQIGSTTNVIGSSYANSAGVLIASTKGTSDAAPVERLRIDSSGNLGLGVTPSAWASDWKVMQIGSRSAFAQYNVNASAIVANNVYFAGTSGSSPTYINTAAASFEQQVNGAFNWYTAASGTAGNAISFTQAMTLDANGNLGVGTTSPAYRLQVETASATGNIVGYFRQGSGAVASIMSTTDLVGFGNGATAGETRIYADGSSGLVTFRTNSTERARIDSSGNLLVGTTSAEINSGVGIKLKNDSAKRLAIVSSESANAGGESLTMYSTGAGAFRFYVGWGGTVYATSTSISAISDQTLKENIRDLETGLTEVMALRPRRFDWKNGDAQDVAGFVAQEVEQVLPELVTDYVYNKDEDGNDIIKKSLKMGDILPTLVKAIQEQQAIITDLRARVAALEAA